MQCQWYEHEELNGAALRDVLLSARHTLEIATADLKNLIVPREKGKGGKARDIAEELWRMASSGVDIRLLHSGVPSESFIRSMRTLKLHDMRPADDPEAPPGSYTMRRCIRCHLKMIVRDGEAIYLGTANLTGAGLGSKSDRNRNFEAGIVTDDAEAVDRGRDLFNAIWDGIFCDECGRTKYCPVPLEEPEF